MEHKFGPDIDNDGEVYGTWNDESSSVRAEKMKELYSKEPELKAEDHMKVVNRLTEQEKDRVVTMTKAFDTFYFTGDREDFDRLFFDEGGLRWLLNRVQTLA